MSTKISLIGQPDAPDLGVHMRYAASKGYPHVEKNSHKGKTAIICSTGSSILNKTVLRQVKQIAKDGAVVFALKESITHLRTKGITPHYSVSMDPSGDRQVARTPIDKDVIYCVASTCHPKLFDHLEGCQVNIFHSACGHTEPEYTAGMVVPAGGEQFAVVDGEFELKTMAEQLPFCPLVPLLKTEIQMYGELFDGYADCMQGGFTVTNRALALAKYMGFEKIYMAGTDFGWRKEGGSHYGNLVKVATIDDNYMTDHGAIDGTPWFTKPDQLASAVEVARGIQHNEVEVIGQSLANALATCSDEFLNEVVQIQGGP